MWLYHSARGKWRKKNKKSVTGGWHLDAFSHKFYGLAVFEIKKKATEDAKIDTFYFVLHFLIRIALPLSTVTEFPAMT